MNKKQTAVEWYIQQCGDLYNSSSATEEEFYLRLSEIQAQAIEMEREQIMKAWKDDCGIIESVADKYASEYYQQTYGKEEL